MRRSHFRLVLIVFLPLLFLAVPAMAQESVLNVSPEDQNLTIKGTLGANVSSFSRAITLVMTGGKENEAKQLQYHRFDLTEQSDPKNTIERSNVSLPTVALTKDHPQDVVITINNVNRYGTYAGDLKFWLPEQNEAQAQVIHLTVEISPKIDVRVPAALSTQVIRCGPLPCALARWLPRSLLGDTRGLLLDNQTPIDVRVLGQNLVLRGDKSGYLITAKDIQLNVPNNLLPARQSVPVEIKLLNRNSLPPDRYTGTMSFSLSGADNPTVVNFTLDVRDGPWYAIAVLLIGIIVGRLVKSMSSPEAILQVKLMGRLYQLQNAIFSLQDERDRRLLLQQLGDMRRRINAATETEPVLSQGLSEIEARINLLGRLESFAQEAMAISDEAVRQGIQKNIDAARSAVVQGNMTDAQQFVDKIQAILLGVKSSAPNGSQMMPMVDRLLFSANAISEDNKDVMEIHAAPAPSRPGWLPVVLSKLAGTDLMSADIRYWLWRPLFFLLLLFLLVLLGLKTLYIDAGASFGSEGIYDYLGLFLWGLSADVVQRTLQNLQLPKAGNSQPT